MGEGGGEGDRRRPINTVCGNDGTLGGGVIVAGIVTRYVVTSVPWFSNWYTAISINVVGSKYKAVRQDLKILWIFL